MLRFRRLASAIRFIHNEVDGDFEREIYEINKSVDLNPPRAVSMLNMPLMSPKDTKKDLPITPVVPGSQLKGLVTAVVTGEAMLDYDKINYIPMVQSNTRTMCWSYIFGGGDVENMRDVDLIVRLAHGPQSDKKNSKPWATHQLLYITEAEIPRLMATRSLQPEVMRKLAAGAGLARREHPIDVISKTPQKTYPLVIPQRDWQRMTAPPALRRTSASKLDKIELADHLKLYLSPLVQYVTHLFVRCIKFDPAELDLLRETKYMDDIFSTGFTDTLVSRVDEYRKAPTRAEEELKKVWRKFHRAIWKHFDEMFYSPVPYRYLEQTVTTYHHQTFEPSRFGNDDLIELLASKPGEDKQKAQLRWLETPAGLNFEFEVDPRDVVPYFGKLNVARLQISNHPVTKIPHLKLKSGSPNSPAEKRLAQEIDDLAHNWWAKCWSSLDTLRKMELEDCDELADDYQFVVPCMDKNRNLCFVVGVPDEYARGVIHSNIRSLEKIKTLFRGCSVYYVQTQFYPDKMYDYSDPSWEEDQEVDSSTDADKDVATTMDDADEADPDSDS